MKVEINAEEKDSASPLRQGVREWGCDWEQIQEPKPDAFWARGKLSYVQRSKSPYNVIF